MAIIITVEDGTGVAGANSWQTIAQVREYAANRGVDLGTDDDVVAAWLIRAAQHMNGFRSKFKGIKVYPAGTMQWPRAGVYIDNVLVVAPAIPSEVLGAQAELVLALKNGAKLGESVIGGVLPVIREKVDVLEIEYATPAMMGAMSGSGWEDDSIPAFDEYMSVLLENVGRFTVRRV